MWTKLGARLKRIHTTGKQKLNWIFIPGGPGLGSEAIAPLTSLLKLPGTIWHLDLPGDGSNPRGAFKNWKPALLEAVRALDNVILVGHSRGGMLALATPELQHLLKGLVLLDAAPDRTWKDRFAQIIPRFPLTKKTLAQMRKHEQAYTKKPSNATLKNFVLSGTPYMFLESCVEKGTRTLKKLPYNYKAIQWAEAHFDPTYKARWIPKIPTLILSGENDLPTPLELFEKKPFLRKNIILKEIPKAGHFPWIENPKDVIAAFNLYVNLVT